MIIIYPFLPTSPLINPQLQTHPCTNEVHFYTMPLCILVLYADFDADASYCTFTFFLPSSGSDYTHTYSVTTVCLLLCSGKYIC